MHYHKPTYDAMDSCLKQLAYLCKENKVKKLALPKIGCGVDKLHWPTVQAMIMETFSNMDIEIKVMIL